MLYYCWKYRKNTDSKNPKIARPKSGRIILLSKCEVRYSKKLKYFKEQKAKGLLSNLTGIKVPILSDIPIVNNLF